MAYFLLYKYDLQEDQKVRKLSFSTEPAAVIRACAVIAEGTGWDFEIQNDNDEVVATDSEIRDRCKQTRIP
jgi:hypothetical protein